MELNDQQRRAVDAGDGPLLVVAGPGAGKTRVLTERIRRLSEEVATPWSLFAVTFTNKAAGEIRERLDDVPGIEHAWIGTFHSRCVQLLRRFADEATVPVNFSIADEDASRRVMADVLKELDLTDAEETPTKMARWVLAHLSRAKNRMTTADALAEPDDPFPWAEVASAYQQRLAALRLADFDDLLVAGERLLRPGTAARRWAEDRFTHVLVDEFQDTNPVQYEIVRHLSAASRNLTVVGDMDQSIYTWRDADPAVLLRFEEDWPDADVVVLGQNYRSTPEILAAASDVIAPNPARWRPALETTRPPGRPVEVVRCADEWDEARFIADVVADADVPDDVAVLVRTNAQTQPIEQELLQRAVPYRVIGTERFYNRAEVRDAMAWLRLLANPYDTLSFARSASAPSDGLGQKSVAHAAEASVASGRPLAEELAENPPPRAQKPAQRWATRLASLEDASRWGAAAVVGEVLDGTVGLRQALLERKDPRSEERVENVEQLRAAAEAFASRSGDGSVAAFCEHVDLVTAADEEESGVRLMTVHAAKGREFPVVVVAGAEDDFLPHARHKEGEELSEERRLLFVAITRAQRRLALTWAAKRSVFGSEQRRKLSPFLAELPADASWRRDRSSRNARPPAPSPAASPRRRPKPPPAPGPRVDPSTLTPGDRVEHTTYGPGSVTRVEGAKVTVAFDTNRNRVLEATFAPLSRVDDADLPAAGQAGH